MEDKSKVELMEFRREDFATDADFISANKAIDALFEDFKAGRMKLQSLNLNLSKMSRKDRRKYLRSKKGKENG